MAPDIRSVIRRIDELSQSENIDKALNEGITAVSEFDAARDYENSIEVLRKLIEITDNSNNELKRDQFASHVQVRYLLTGNKNRARIIRDKYDLSNKIPLSSLIDILLSEKMDKDHLTIENIEKQTIFGDYVAIRELPFVQFSREEDAIQLIEDYYTAGRYTINLINSQTSLHQSISFEKGDVENVNIVEREKIFRLSK